MRSEFFKQSLFVRVMSFVIIASFLLTSGPVNLYAQTRNTDALRAPAAVAKRGNPLKQLVDDLKAKGSPKAVSASKTYATLDDIEVGGKITLVRPDINVPAEGGHIKDITHPAARVVAAAETIKELAEKDGKVVVIFHQGRPGEPDFMDTPFEHAQQMSAIIGRKIKAVNDLFGTEAIAAIKALKPGEIIFLKPVRAADPSLPGKILEENPYFVSVLRPLIDVFCLDGFSVAHRDSPSVTGFKGVPTIAGRLMEREIEGNSKLLTPAKPRFVAVGGGKLADKFPGFKGELQKADKVLVAGRLANLALVAAQPEAAGANTEDKQYELAVKTVGKPTADELKAEGLNLLQELVGLLAANKDRIMLPVDMVYLDASEVRHNVDLVNGRVPEGFQYTLKGIGPRTLQEAVAIIKQGKFQSGHLTGPLTDSRFDALLEENRILLAAYQEAIPFWAIGGGDTDSVVSKLGFEPSFTTLAGSASLEFLAGNVLPGVELLKNNRPDRVKPYVPSTSGETHALAHAEALGIIAKAFQEAGARMFVRTHVFIDGGKVDAVGFAKTPMSTAVRELILKSLCSGTLQAFAGLETLNIDAQNPYINFSISNLYTPDHRPINPARLRQALAENANVALILVPGDIDKKGRMGPAGDIDSKKITDKLEKILNQALREHGVDVQAVKDAIPRPLPVIAQVTESGIKSYADAKPGELSALELKLALLVPTPGSEIYRLMQLAQEAGINLKELLEKKMPVIPDEKAAQIEAQLLQLSLLGEAPVLAAAVKKEAKPQGSSFLSGLSFGGAKINEALQTIFVTGTDVPHLFRSDLEEIARRVIDTQKSVRIVIPAGGALEQEMRKTLNEEMPGLTVGTHSMQYQGRGSIAFIIRPTKHVVMVGYGNEAIKLAPLYEAAGFKVAVAVNSFNRLERVVHAFDMGYEVLLADIVKDKSGNVTNRYEDPTKLGEAGAELRGLLEEAFTAKAKNLLLGQLPESERLQKANDPGIFRQAAERGRKEAAERLSRQYKGVLSKAIMAGNYDVIDDATPEGSGANNRELMYEPAIKANPDKRIVVLYQGGEKAEVAQVSFSTISADFEDVANLAQVRHVSCNTTGLSTILLPVLEALGVSIDLDNTALRRGPDPGDIKGVPASITMQSNYHHWPDLLTVAPENLKALMRGNTDAAQVGTNTRFHIHMLYLRRADGKPFDKQMVQRIEAVQSRVALVDFPGDMFDSTRLTELAHNLLPQSLTWAPDGADHLLVPVLMVQETDDPAQLRFIYAVPQESIVAPGNINAADALLGQASKDASMAMINDASGISQIVPAVETRLPVKGLEQPTITPALATTEIVPVNEVVRGSDGGFITAADHRAVNKYIESIEGRSDVYRVDEVQDEFGITYIQALPGMTDHLLKETGRIIRGHYPVRPTPNGISYIYIDKDTYAGPYGESFVKHELGERSLLRRFAADKNWTLDQLVQWLETGPENEARRVLVNIHNAAPEIPKGALEIIRDLPARMRIILPGERAVRGAASSNPTQLEDLRDIDMIAYSIFAEPYLNFVNSNSLRGLSQNSGALVIGAHAIFENVGAITTLYNNGLNKAFPVIYWAQPDEKGENSAVQKLKAMGVLETDIVYSQGLQEVWNRLNKLHINPDRSALIISPSDLETTPPEEITQINNSGVYTLRLQKPQVAEREAKINSMPLVIARAITSILHDNNVVREFTKLAQVYKDKEQISQEDFQALTDDLASQFCDVPLVKTTEEIARNQLSYEEMVDQI